ncbi:MAG TPA: hypothetical protein VFO40_06335 [Chthoniobacterales bacterium]|nr:hypothetical protein [Chthoniobacterales bacterium]
MQINRDNLEAKHASKEVHDGENRKEINHDRRNRRRFLAITAITIAAARFGVTGSARAQSNKTTPADLRAIKVQPMAPAAIRLPII